MQIGQGYLNGEFNIIHFCLYIVVKVTVVLIGIISGKIVSPAYYLFKLVRQENSRTRRDGYHSWHFL